MKIGGYRVAQTAAMRPAQPPADEGDRVELSRAVDAVEKASRLEPAWQTRLEGSFIGPDQGRANTLPIVDSEGSLYLGTMTQFVKLNPEGQVVWRLEQPPKHSILKSFPLGRKGENIAIVHNYFEPLVGGGRRGGTAVKVVDAATGAGVASVLDINYETVKRTQEGSLMVACSTGEVYHLQPNEQPKLLKEKADLSQFSGQISHHQAYVYDLQPGGRGAFAATSAGLKLLDDEGVWQTLTVEGQTHFVDSLKPCKDGGVYCKSQTATGIMLSRVDGQGQVSWTYPVSQRGLLHTATDDGGLATAEFDEAGGQITFAKFSPEGERLWQLQHPDIASNGSGQVGLETRQDWPELTLAAGPEGSLMVLSRELGLATSLQDGKVAWTHQSAIEEHGRGLDIKARPTYTVTEQGKLWVTFEGGLERIDLKSGESELSYDPKSRVYAEKGRDTTMLQGTPFRFLGNVMEGPERRLYSLGKDGSYAAVDLPLSLQEALEQEPAVDLSQDIEFMPDYIDVGGILIPN